MTKESSRKYLSRQQFKSVKWELFHIPALAQAECESKLRGLREGEKLNLSLVKLS